MPMKLRISVILKCVALFTIPESSHFGVDFIGCQNMKMKNAVRISTSINEHHILFRLNSKQFSGKCFVFAWNRTIADDASICSPTTCTTYFKNIFLAFYFDLARFIE